ncbi:hypothetical protein EVAR_3624_1 [Eumeta japonica]|uniref:Uncharacterized protein n=1 Tax=Eumeta variegata TaxID=151549 RepID=A0A4C1SYP3_EUMVA|nr:hypothetical protein EVAR_3624_1 [Eumeta japonica]
MPNVRCSGGARRRRRRRPPTASRLKGPRKQKSFAYKLLKRGLANLMSPTSTSGVAPPLNYSVLSRFDGPGCGSASDRVSELNTSGRTGEGVLMLAVHHQKTRSDAEPQPGPSKRLRTGSSNLENHRGLCLWGYHESISTLFQVISICLHILTYDCVYVCGCVCVCVGGCVGGCVCARRCVRGLSTPIRQCVRSSIRRSIGQIKGLGLKKKRSQAIHARPVPITTHQKVLGPTKIAVKFSVLSRAVAVRCCHQIDDDSSHQLPTRAMPARNARSLAP